MGYRSNGRWVITGKEGAIKAARAAVLLHPPTYKEHPKIEEDAPKLSDFKVYFLNGYGYIRFQFEDWKWYGSYPAVQFYEEVWNALKQLYMEGLEISGKRVHIGEDNAVEEESFGDDNVDLHVSVRFEDSEPEAP